MAEKKIKRKTPTGTGFEFGAAVLDMTVDAIIDVYETTIGVLEGGIATGKAQPAIGLMHTLAYIDLLHGGAYAAPINQRPFYLKNPANSKYYAGNLQNLVDSTWIAWLAQATSGTSATLMANEILIDANVPHVFPKLLSDETTAQIKILFAQAATTDLFTKTSTGITTLVEGVASLKGKGGGGRKKKGDDDEDGEQQGRGLLGEIGKLG